VASLSQGRTAAAQCGLFTHKSVPVIFEPPCNMHTLQRVKAEQFSILNLRKMFLWEVKKYDSSYVSLSF